MAAPSDARVLLYVRIANALRDKIRLGEIRLHDRFLSMEELCASYEVSRNTMRQAMAVLRDEGLIESTRGRGTVVIKTVEERTFKHAIVDAISNPLESKGINIHVVSRSDSETLPAVLAGADETYESYARIQKLHVHDGVIFGHIDVYVESAAYNKLPERADENQLIGRLLSSHAGVTFSAWSVETTVGYPDEIVAERLQYSMTEPIVITRRRRLDQFGKIVVAAELQFPAGLFMLKTSGEGPRAPQATMAPPPVEKSG